MTHSTEFFADEIEKQIKKNERMKRKPGNTIYGDNVMPILKLYKSLSEFSERESFRNALEKMLTDQSEEKRRFAIDVCLGFLVFRDAIEFLDVIASLRKAILCLQVS